MFLTKEGLDLNQSRVRVCFNDCYSIAELNAGLEIFEYIHAQKPSGSSGYQSGGKILTKNLLMKKLQDKVSG